jgi:hypothetical protein
MTIARTLLTSRRSGWPAGSMRAAPVSRIAAAVDSAERNGSVTLVLAAAPEACAAHPAGMINASRSL